MSRYRYNSVIGILTMLGVTKAQSIYNTLVQESNRYLMQGEVQMSIAWMEKMLIGKELR